MSYVKQAIEQLDSIRNDIYKARVELDTISSVIDMSSDQMHVQYSKITGELSALLQKESMAVVMLEVAQKIEQGE